MKYNFKNENLIKLLIEGKSCPDIAKIYNVNKQVIQRIVKKLELPQDILIKARPSNKPFTQKELDVLIGGLLGDTWLGYIKFGKNACGSFTHKLEHKEYVEYKYNLLKRLCSVPTIHNKNDKRTNRFYQQSFCKINTNPLLNDIVNKFYINKKKTINKEYLDKLSPLAVAIWYMDDGSKLEYAYKFSTDCFTLEEKQLLVDWLKKFNINSTIPEKTGQIYIKAESKNSFTNLIKDFIPNCMKYKLHNLSS